VKSVTMGIPGGHKHVRTIIETDAGKFIFQEATVAAIVRAYTTIKTHPQTRAVRLVGKETEERKKGYAAYQLVETGESPLELSNELAGIVNGFSTGKNSAAIQ